MRRRAQRAPFKHAAEIETRRAVHSAQLPDREWRKVLVSRDPYTLRMIILRVTMGAAMKQATARLCHLWIDFALQRSRTLHENVRSPRIIPRESVLAAEELQPIPME